MTKTTQTVAKTKSGKRVEDFTKAKKDQIKQQNAAENGGQMKCNDCPKPVESLANEKGVPTPSNQAQVHHETPIVSGGTKDSDGVVLCPDCHHKRHHPEK